MSAYYKEEPMYLVSGHFHYKPDSVAAAKALMNRMMQLGHTEPGINRYTFYEDPEDAARFFLYEEWDSKDEHDAHFNSEAMQAMVPELMDALSAPPVVVYYDATVESTL